MSVVAICGGVAVYFMLRSYLLVNEGPPLLRHIKGQRIFDRVLVTVSWRLARWLENLLGTRRLQPQLQLLVCAALLAGFGADLRARVGVRRLGARPHSISCSRWSGPSGSPARLAAAYQAKFHRLAALILLGGAGLVTCISFVWLSAPDLALTQLVVETVTTVLLLLGLRWLPKRIAGRSASPASTRRSIRWYRVARLRHRGRGRSGIGGAGLRGHDPPGTRTASARFFVENAYTQGGGTNIVNVILVDFRAFDTFGEITVLGIVALTVYALLRRFRPAAESIPVPEQQRTPESSTTSASRPPERRHGQERHGRPRAHDGNAFSGDRRHAVFLLLRGHDLPGGGFVAGVTMAVAFILQYMARGTVWVEARLRILPVRWMGIGLLLAAGVGAAAWLFDRPFLSSSFSYVEIPLIGAVPIASALLFDLGVFALVVGATVLMLIAIAHQSVRSHRAPAAAHRDAPAAPPRPRCT